MKQEVPSIRPATSETAREGTRRLPIVVIAGRPNVGKSTLVNRFVGRRVAVVEEKPGVTRDRLELEAEWNGRSFIVVDTGGWLGGGDPLDSKVAAQAEKAIADADLVLLVVDTVVGITTEDEDVARLLLRCGRPVRVIANKVDNERREAEAWSFLSLGLGDPIMVSALHGRGTGDLLDEVLSHLPAEHELPDATSSSSTSKVAARRRKVDREFADESVTDTDVFADLPGEPPNHHPSETRGVDLADDLEVDEELLAATEFDDEELSDELLDDFDTGVFDDTDCPRVAIVGRPNVGKSTLFNKLIGEERSVVHDMPGTTRDAVDTVVETPEGLVRFVDTAGMRRRSRTESGTEYFAMVRALEALDRADIALLVIDATEGVTHQDQRLAERIGVSGSPTIVVLNKWELVPTEDRVDVLTDVGDRLAFLGDAPVLKVSARSGRGVHRVLPALRLTVDAYHRRIPTGELNRAIRAIQIAHPCPGSRIRYAVQAATDPPTFTIFATRRLPAPYLRYLERKLREHFEIGPTPVNFRVRLRRG
jgi:GTP-binding protein